MNRETISTDQRLDRRCIVYRYDDDADEEIEDKRPESVVRDGLVVNQSIPSLRA